MTHSKRLPLRPAIALFLAALAPLAVGCAQAPSDARASNDSLEPSWSAFGSDAAFTRYSPLDQINHDNVMELEILWRRPAVDPDFLQENDDVVVPRYLLSTPQMISGVLYASNGVGLVEALDPATGATLWMQDPGEEIAGRSNRGLGYWTDGLAHRLFSVRGEYLYSIDRETGELDSGFGDEGRVYLRRSEPGSLPFSSLSGMVVVDDVIVLSGLRGGAGDRSPVKEREPEDVMGYDVRTGDLLWTFHVIPRQGEYGIDTWGEGSWEYAGDGGSWCCLSADEELGYVYVPFSAPTGFYGGWRPGDNLFTNSLVAIEARTGERVWHFQAIRHGIWEHELAGAPTLGDIVVDGEQIPAVIQPSKQGLIYTFNRETGEPVWPIEDRPVPPSTVPGEAASPTQPFPTKPAPFGRIGITEDDLIDFTPELRASAREYVQNLNLETELFAPPPLVTDVESGEVAGSLTLPGTWGAGNWHTGAFDPETGFYYAQAHALPGVVAITPATSLEEETVEYPRIGPSPLLGPEGLPLVGPPYGTITAIDMNTGEHVWSRTNGSAVNEHPLLRDLDLPPLGTPSRPSALVTQSLLFVGDGSDIFGGIDFGGRFFRAYDKGTGEVVWEMELPGGTTSQPMTYLHEGKQYIVVPIGDSESPAEWVALGLP